MTVGTLCRLRSRAKGERVQGNRNGVLSVFGRFRAAAILAGLTVALGVTATLLAGALIGVGVAVVFALAGVNAVGTKKGPSRPVETAGGSDSHE